MNDVKKTREFEEVLHFFREELSKIRTGRAQVSLVDSVMVEAYGTTTPINQLASLSIPEPRTIAIAPWDKSILGAIEKAIRKTDNGINPQNDGEIIRIVLPALTEESRKELVKRVAKKAEEARIRVRNIREDAIKIFDREENQGEISEDEKFQKKASLQKEVDYFNEEIERIRKEKEAEVMTV